MTAELRFVVDWESAPHVRSPELRATWARLEVWVGRDCVTQVEDLATGSVRRSIYCSIYPLAEWIAYNWWSILADARPAVVPTSTWSYRRLGIDRESFRWLDHHNFRAAAEGFLWPDLTVVPEGATTRLTWKRDRGSADHQLLRFLGDGEQNLDFENVRLALAQLVNQTVARLAEHEIGESVLFHEWSAIEGADAAETDFCIAAARLGLDPYSAADEVASDLTRAAGMLDGPLLEDFLNAVEPTGISRALDWVGVAAAAVDRSTRSGELGQLIQLVGDAGGGALTRGKPWEQGWNEARTVRDLLEMAPDEVFPADRFIRSRVLADRSPDHALQAVGGAGSDNSGLLVLGEGTGMTGRRFRQGRGLWHLLFGADRSRHFLLTPARTDRQKTERAFAAELLAPAIGVREQLPVDPSKASSEDIDAAAAYFKVSPLLVRHQLENQLLAA